MPWPTSLRLVCRDKTVMISGGDQVEPTAVTPPMRRALEAGHEEAVEGAGSVHSSLAEQTGKSLEGPLH